MIFQSARRPTRLCAAWPIAMAVSLGRDLQRLPLALSASEQLSLLFVNARVAAQWIFVSQTAFRENINFKIPVASNERPSLRSRLLQQFRSAASYCVFPSRAGADRLWRPSEAPLLRFRRVSPIPETCE